MLDNNKVHPVKIPRMNKTDFLVISTPISTNYTKFPHILVPTTFIDEQEQFQIAMPASTCSLWDYVPIVQANNTITY